MLNGWDCCLYQFVGFVNPFSFQLWICRTLAYIGVGHMDIKHQNLQVYVLGFFKLFVVHRYN
jgi:hypothetical protein